MHESEDEIKMNNLSNLKSVKQNLTQSELDLLINEKYLEYQRSNQRFNG